MTEVGGEHSMERFREYRRTGDRALRNELMAEHTRLAEALARRMMHRGEPLEDLCQVAMVGLLKAVERFDPDHGVRFSSFATPTILGELKRHFRDRGWAVRVPRRIQELHLAVRDTTVALHQELGRPPTTGEIAERLSVREEDVIESMEAGTLYRLTSLDADPGGQPERATGERDPHLDAVDDRVTADRLLALLPDREQRIMRMRFYEGRTQGEIAQRIGVSQMQVSRLIARSIETLGAHARRSLDDAPVAR
ncbi:MAG TPA: SigB/SigF/SigG family RNA polymerase sigma factor [Acidimicrobiia bacterium]